MSLPVRPRWLVAPLLSALLLGVAPVLPAAAEPVDPAPAVAAEPVDSGLAPLAEPASYPVPEQRASLAAAAGLPQYSLVDLGAGTTSNAAEVNEQGHVAGTLFESTGEQPVLWRGDEVVRLDTGGAKLVRALSLGDDGTVGGWMYDATAGKRYAVAWRPDEDGDYGKLQRVSEVSSYQSSLSGGEVQSVGARGELHVTEPRQHVPFGSDAVLQGSEVTELGPLSTAGPAVGTYDLSANGVFATGLAGDGKSNVDAAVWTAGSPAVLPDPLRDAGVARGLAVDDEGDVVVEAVRSGGEDGPTARAVALYRGGEYTHLGNLYGDGDPEASNLVPWDLNDRDEVVGAANVVWHGKEMQLAFLWRDGRAVDLTALLPENSGWTLNSAHSINERGQIVGIASRGDVTTAFLLDPTRPLLFVPGAGASILKSYDDPAAPEEIWLGCGSDRMKLSLFDADEERARDVRAVDATRYLECRGASGRWLDALDAYGSMLDLLKTKHGYREYDVAENPRRRTAAGCDLTQKDQGPNLFVFAYDWRKDNRESAVQLADYVRCIQRLHPGVEIDVVTHSMGSLVTRRYVNDNRGATGIHKIVTIGAPWLGAPKLVSVLHTGDFVNAIANGGSDKVRHVVGGFPAAHQLMSGPYYHRLVGPVFQERGWDYDGDGAVHENYAWPELRKALDERWKQTEPALTAEAFQAAGGSDGLSDWSDDTSGEDWTIVFGIQAGEDTIGRVNAVRGVHCTVRIVSCTTEDYIAQEMVEGDGTVPTPSASRMGAGLDLNGPTAKLVPVPVLSTSDNDTVEHTALTRNPRVLKVMMDTFRGTGGDRGVQAAAEVGKPEGATPAPYRYVTVRGATDVVLADGKGNDDRPIDDGVRIPLPGSQHLRQGEHGSLVTMPAEVGHPWTVTFQGTGTPLWLESLEGTQSAPRVAVRWQDVELPAGAAAELTLTPTGLERLRIDTDGDDTVDTVVPPTADVSGEDARDVDPPSVSLVATRVDGEQRYAVTASDGKAGSGVRRILWSSDNRSFAEYREPVRRPLTAALYAFAEDWAGNRSTIAELETHAAVVAPVTTLSLDPAPSGAGWSAGTTTATLRARAVEDGAPVTAVRWYTTGAQTVEETGVEGDTAQVVVDRPGRTTLWYSAVAADGTQEPWRSHVLRLDAAAPTLRLRSPAPGSVVGGLAQVAGTAADDASGVRQVEVLLERTSDSATWDGERWSEQQSWLPASGSRTWRTTDLPTAEQLAEGAYAVRARAVDGAGRRTTSPAITFVKGHEGRMTMTELGPAPGVTAPASARAIADDGTAFGTVGGFTTVPTRWVGGSAQAMRLPAGTTEAIVWGAAGDGSVAGSARDTSSRTVAVRWSPDGTPQVLPHLPGRTSSRAVAVSAAGAVGDSGGRPVWWRPDGTAVELPGLVPGQTGVAEDLDDAGTVVGHVLDADGQQHAVVWTDQGRQVTDLGTLGGVGAAALGINDVGQVVGWARDELRRTRAFVADVYDGEAMADAGVSAEYSTAHDIGDDGTILGEYADDAGHEADRNAFLVTDGRFRSLNLAIDPEAGWVPSRAYAVNGLGQVVGFGLRNGLSRGFLASGTHAPVAGDVVAETDEGTPVRLRLPASDPDPGAELALQVVGGPSHGTLSAVEGGEVVYTPQPGFTGTDAFSFLASDGALRSNLARASITVRRGPGGNQHPVAVVTAPATAAEGTTVVLDGSSSSDADGEIASFAWDLDGDGAFDDATGPTAQLALPDEGVRPVALQVTDDRGATGTGSSSVEGTNVVPLVSLPTTERVEAGTALRLVGRFSDPGADTWRATVDTGGGPVELPLSGAAFTVDVTWTEPGSRTVVVQVCDGTACGTATTTVEVTRNAAPTAVLTAPQAPVEGSTVHLDGTGSSDADGTVASHAWDLDGDREYDDATGATAELPVPQDGRFEVGLQVTDDRGATGTARTTLLVWNAAPVLDVAPSSSAVAGRPWSLSGSFTDPGADTWTATVDTGGGEQPLTLSGKGFTLAATFPQAGTQEVVVEVCDGAACGSRTVVVTVAPATTTWPWQGFFSPVDNAPVVNVLQAGQAVPLRFSLGGYRGMDVVAAGSPTSRAHTCSGTTPTDAVEEAVNPGGSALTYAAGSDRYQYVWKTQKAWAGQCRTFTLTLADGSVHTAEFRFR